MNFTIEQLKLSIYQGVVPQITSSGTSGSYIFNDVRGKRLAIFKPYDEEPNAPKNPKGFVGKLGSPALKEGILSGEAAVREVSAFILDKLNFHSVPETGYIALKTEMPNNEHKEEEVKFGSL